MPAPSRFLPAAAMRQLTRRAPAARRGAARPLASASPASPPPPPRGSPNVNWVFAAPGGGVPLVTLAAAPAAAEDAPSPSRAGGDPNTAAPPFGLARLSAAEATGIVMGAVLGLGAPLPSADRVR
jgi:hypothetical protein